MIIDKIENAKNYYGLGEKFQKAFEYLKSNDLENMENGKYEKIRKKMKLTIPPDDLAAVHIVELPEP